ncbi:MAG: hypothetical protein U0T82_16260 [Bacteroidales bacterium]
MKTISLVSLCLLIASMTCKKEEYLKLRINNTTNAPIYTAWTRDFPDTTFTYMLNPTLNPQTDRVEAKSLQKKHYYSLTNDIFDAWVDTISVFIFDAQLLDSTPWDTVKAKYLVLKRYDLSLDDLNRMNWIINYP